MTQNNPQSQWSRQYAAARSLNQAVEALSRDDEQSAAAYIDQAKQLLEGQERP